MKTPDLPERENLILFCRFAKGQFYSSERIRQMENDPSRTKSTRFQLLDLFIITPEPSLELYKWRLGSAFFCEIFYMFSSSII